MLPLAQRQGVGVIVRSVLLRGVLRHRYRLLPPALEDLKTAIGKLAEVADAEEISVSEMAYRFVLAHPAVSTALVGTVRIEELEAALAFAARRDTLACVACSDPPGRRSTDRNQLVPCTWPADMGRVARFYGITLDGRKPCPPYHTPPGPISAFFAASRWFRARPRSVMPTCTCGRYRIFLRLATTPSASWRQRQSAFPSTGSGWPSFCLAVRVEGGLILPGIGWRDRRPGGKGPKRVHRRGDGRQPGAGAGRCWSRRTWTRNTCGGKFAGWVARPQVLSRAERQDAHLGSGHSRPPARGPGQGRS